MSRASAFESLLSNLPGYAGLLVNDARVVGGTDSYTGGEIKVGLIFKSSAVEVTGARVILPELDYEFAGRPPLEVRVRLNHAGASHEAVVIVLHAKANQDVTSWERRAAAGAGLKEHLESIWPTTSCSSPVTGTTTWTSRSPRAATPHTGRSSTRSPTGYSPPPR